MTAPRIIVAGATTAITRRTTLRKAFLAPWDPLVRQIWLYSLANAQHETDVAVHHGICVINHHHLTVTPTRNNLPEFSQRVHRDISCALNDLLSLRRYDTPRELFDGREPHYMRLLDAPAQSSQFVYEHNNCVAAGLVRRPEHMPDYTFHCGLWKSGYLDVERPPVYFSSKRPKRLRLAVTPPPLLLAAFGGDIDRLVYYMQRLSDDTGRTLRAAHTRPVLGTRRVQRLHPWSEPRTLREPGGQRVPTFRIGARGIDGRRMATQAAHETHTFRKEHAEARVLHKLGERVASYPHGSYAAPILQGAPVQAQPKPGALVTAPGPTYWDVRAMFSVQRPDQDEVAEQTFAMIEEVRAAVQSEAADLHERDFMDFDHRGPSSTLSSARASAGSKAPNSAPKAPRRVAVEGDVVHIRRTVTLRDSRRGRPNARVQRHTSDPPG